MIEKMKFLQKTDNLYCSCQCECGCYCFCFVECIETLEYDNLYYVPHLQNEGSNWNRKEASNSRKVNVG